MSNSGKLQKRKRSKTHGFLVRQKTAGGKQIIKNRRRKGRKNLSA